MSSEAHSFVLPTISNNIEAWGPNCADVASKHDDGLFQPYTKDKSDRHWKISDWNVSKLRGMYLLSFWQKKFQKYFHP